jgi:hypothetical protein
MRETMLLKYRPVVKKKKVTHQLANIELQIKPVTRFQFKNHLIIVGMDNRRNEKHLYNLFRLLLDD